MSNFDDNYNSVRHLHCEEDIRTLCNALSVLNVPDGLDLNTYTAISRSIKARLHICTRSAFFVHNLGFRYPE